MKQGSEFYLTQGDRVGLCATNDKFGLAGGWRLTYRRLTYKIFSKTFS